MSSSKKYNASQKKHHDNQSLDKSSLFNKKTVDYWRHSRMYRYIQPFLKIDIKASWLTVGDGKYGHEAHYIESFGSSALATDISIKLLQVSKKFKYIKNFKQANAEKLPFKNKKFDYVFCKESYHHFPKPTIALYEMIRVAKKAIILIEPNDVSKRGFSWSKINSVEKIKDKINKFEISGNYVYTLCRREVEKIALGIGMPTIAFCGLDDHYIRGVEKEKIKNNTKNYFKIKLILLVLNIFYKLGLRDRSLLVSIIFIKKPNKKISKALSSLGYKIHHLPKNPYIK